MKVVNENNCVIEKKDRIPFDFDYDIKEYFDLNKIAMINNILESRKALEGLDSVIGNPFWGYQFSSYEETIAENLLLNQLKSEEDSSYKKCLTDNHFTAAYTLNHFFYHNYRNSERSIDTFAKAIAVDCASYIAEENGSNTWLEESDIDAWLEDWDSIESSTIYGAARAAGQLAKELTDSELETIVGTDLLPYAKYVLNEGFMFFLDICRSYYRDREGILYDMISFFFEENRDLMVRYIEEHLYC